MTKWHFHRRRDNIVWNLSPYFNTVDLWTFHALKCLFSTLHLPSELSHHQILKQSPSSFHHHLLPALLLVPLQHQLSTRVPKVKDSSLVKDFSFAFFNSLSYLVHDGQDVVWVLGSHHQGHHPHHGDAHHHQESEYIGGRPLNLVFRPRCDVNCQSSNATHCDDHVDESPF